MTRVRRAPSFMKNETLSPFKQGLTRRNTHRYAGFNEGGLDNSSFVAIRHKVTPYGERRLCTHKQPRSRGGH